MLNKMALISAGFMLAATGCGGPADSGGTELGRETQGLASPAQHCVGKSFAQPKGLAAPEALPETQFTCFDTFAQAIAHVSQGTVQLAAGARPEELKQEDVDQMASLAQYVIGIEYEHRDYGGSSLIIYSDYTCTEFDQWVSALPSNWNDRISSSLAYSGCNYSWHYENANFGGAVINCGAGCANLGGTAMNDRTSSIYWHL